MTRPPGDAPPAGLLARWGARVDGPAVAGWMGRVWPVLGPGGERWVLKLTDAGHPPTHEGAALRAWAAAGAHVVRLVAHHEGALLLERLSSRHLSAVPDVEEADAVLAECLAGLARVPAPPEVPLVTDALRRTADSVRAHRHDAPGVLPGSAIDRALATLEAVTADRDGPAGGSPELVHFDLHYENVLAGPPGDARGWVVIDPLPHAGGREVEVVAALRNRFADAAATGDPDAHLRRRLHRLAEAADLDLDLARDLAQAVAVDNVLWLARRDPGHLHLPAYRVLARW